MNTKTRFENPVNYYEDPIPNIEKLYSDVSALESGVCQIDKFKFDDLFKKASNGDWNKNLEVLNRIGFNTKLREKDKSSNEIKGLYILYEGNIPSYVGISRAVLRRLKNHFLGKSHFEASLVYLMARERHDKEVEYYKGTRSEFPFDSYRISKQKEMLEKWRIAIIPMTDSYQLYLSEIYFACQLKTYWNSFRTH